MRARLLALLLALLPALPAVAAPGDRFLACDRWSGDVADAVRRWWQDWPDPLDWQAQLFQESRCNPLARSPVGALGLAQFMPGTWTDILRRLGEDPRQVPPTTARVAIRAGAYYMRLLRDQWRGWSASPGYSRADAAEVQRHAQAGYNAGSGHILKAWRACGRPEGWRATRTCLPQITGRHAAETIAYVDRIAEWRALLGRRR